MNSVIGISYCTFSEIWPFLTSFCFEKIRFMNLSNGFSLLTGKPARYYTLSLKVEANRF